MAPPLSRVSEEETTALISPVSDREISEAVRSLAGDKAPGPDGFPPLFFQRYWMIVGRDVTAAIQQFFRTAVMAGDWQRTFITLIPKRQDASEPGHFRPISLCTTLYKATARILAGRLRDVLPRLISPEQGAFLEGRSISDNVLIAQEFMFDLGRAPMRRSLMGVKLDMERAYDRVRWDFLQQSLQEFGFHEIWISWVMGCVRAPSFAILVNDALSRSLRRAVATQELEVYRPAVGASPISHLLFADDCLLLARSSRQVAQAIGQILQDYCAASGQRVNLTKSAIIFSPKTKVEVRRSILESLGVGEQEGTMTYLGVPLSGHRLRSRDCTSMELSIRRRLEGWQMLTLSMMGRITLVRLVLTSIPIFLLSNAIIPVRVLRSFEQLFRKFIWGRSSGRGGVHLLAWDVVCQPTSHGGLGVQSLVARRKALVARHAARFVLEPESMWSSLMRAKYGTLVPGARAGRHHSPIWREMCASAGVVLPEIRWTIGDGRSIDVLQDSWVTELPICCMPTMVDSTRLSGCRVSELLTLEGGRWREELIREVFGEQLAESVLSLPVPSGGGADRLVWMPTGRSRVRVRDLHALIGREPARQIEGGWIWRMRIHPRVALFIWKVAWGCLPTRSILVRRGMAVSQCCEECADIEETIEHVLLRCPRAREIWRRSPVLLPDSVVFAQDLIHMECRSFRGEEVVSEDGGTQSDAICEGGSCGYRRVFFWVNFDGSRSADGVTGGVGFVIRDHLGRMIAAGGRRTPGLTVVGAELQAAWEGISYAWHVLGVERVCLEGDSSVVIDWIRGADRFGDGHPLVRETRGLVRLMGEVQIGHVFREANRAADWVASFVARHSGDFQWTSVSDVHPSLYLLLSRDMAGCTHVRVI
ncbi:uncharacterized protein LOC120111407 [Phoenix dactylifera]|uniref:Uncharacterized protein LOC120111407 n=1 Tax=Phoenix dactylifera TaxID=42345 RepID=A0A8B9ACG5_PHODC|nr:uncharacterized protein LOC120111407 [Phoenix dactylifera]